MVICEFCIKYIKNMIVLLKNNNKYLFIFISMILFAIYICHFHDICLFFNRYGKLI
ncbi:hypothetical protein VRK_35410 [Vibrio sp. MEBiC08052]|nr:hypothetical protein VRK_35410 [Vibrio sp. MEBiC08052]